MTTSLDRVNTALTYFFGTLLSDAQRTTLDGLGQGAAAGALEIFAGTYKAWGGAAVPCIGGHRVTPTWGIHANPTALPWAAGKPKATSLDPGATAHKRPLVWLRDVADAKIDTRSEIARVMENINFYSATVSGGAARDAQAWAKAVIQARGVNELPDNVNQIHAVPASFSKLTDDVTELRQVLHHFFSYRDDGSYYARWASTPHNSPDNLSPECKQLTITELQLVAGEVYLYSIVPESFLSGRRSGNRLREVVWAFSFGGGDTVVRASVLHTVECASAGGDFYDFIAFHADEGLRTLYRDGGRVAVPESAAASLTPGLTDLLATAPDDDAKRLDFMKASAHIPAEGTHVPVFLELSSPGPVPEGVELFGHEGGLLQLASVPVGKLAELAALPHVAWVSEPTPLLERNTQARAQLHLSDGPYLFKTSPLMKSPLVRKVQEALKAKGHFPHTVDGEFGDRTHTAVRAFQTAERIDVDGVVGSSTAARLGLTWDAVDQNGGKGVVIGIIDSGIHGIHPAFYQGGSTANPTRIQSVWTPNATAGARPGPRLAALAGGYFAQTYGEVRGDAKLNSAQWLNRGAELVGAGTSAARDGGSGHGTHVAGIAAGAGVAGAAPCPAGMAPQADIVAVQGYWDDAKNNPIETGIDDWMVIRAIEYVREIASHRPKVKDPAGVDQPAPVVVNMSFGHHQHAHDQTDNLARWLESFSTRNKDGSRVKGLAICAAAGNERGKHYHDTISVPVQSGGTKGSATLSVRMSPRIGSASQTVLRNASDIEDVNIWIRNDSAGNTASDLEVQVQSQGSVVQTATQAQRANNDYVWSTFLGAGVHIGVSHGPKRGRNNDFNIRVILQTAKGIVQDPSGYSIPGVADTWRTVNLDRNGNIVGTATKPFRSFPVGAWLANVGGTGTFQDNRNWQIILRNSSTAKVRAGHAWMGKESSRFMNAAFTAAAGVDSHLICSPAHSKGVISVAATTSDLKFVTVAGAQDDSPQEWGPPPVASHDVTRAITSFSSPGPLNTTNADPGIDIAAPGANLASARGAWTGTALAVQNNRDVNANTHYMAGTSMASPAVAGVLANILAEEPTLTLDEIRDRLQRCAIARKLSDGSRQSAAVRNNAAGVLETGAPQTANDWGHGILDARRMK